MENKECARNILRGFEGRIFDLVFRSPKKWAAFLRTLLERAAAQGDAVLVDKLMEAGAGFGYAVDEAVGSGHLVIVNKLLERGATLDLGSRNRHGVTPLHVAAEHGKQEMVQFLLLKGADKDAVDVYGCSPLHMAADHDRAAVVQVLLDAGVDTSVRCNEWNMSALHLAARKGHLEVLRTLIDHGVQVDATSGLKDLTALHFAAALEDKPEAIDMLVEAGGNVEAQTTGGGTPLHMAAATSNPEAVLALLRHGAQANTQDSNCLTPLHDAALRAGTCGVGEIHAGRRDETEAVVAVLLRAGADETMRDDLGDVAVENVGYWVKNPDAVAEKLERVRKLFASAPADRAWRRRGLFVLCRARPGRVQLPLESTRARVGVLPGTGGSGAKLARVEAVGGSDAGGSTMSCGRDGEEWAVVAATVVRLEEEGIFRTIVGYL